MFKVRKFKAWYYVLLVIVLVASVWCNIKCLQMETIACTSTDGVCHQIQSYLNFEYFSFGSIVLFALMVIYLYLFNSRKTPNSELNDTVGKTNENHNSGQDEIDFNQESARNYTKSYLDSESAK